MQLLAIHPSALYRNKRDQDIPNKLLASSTVTVNPLFVTVTVARYAIISICRKVKGYVHSQTQS